MELGSEDVSSFSEDVMYIYICVLNGDCHKIFFSWKQSNHNSTVYHNQITTTVLLYFMHY